MSVNPHDACAKLIEALRIVRDRQASSADDWESSLLRTFVKYLEAIGVDPDLRLPVWTMYIAKWNETQKARRRKASKPGTPMPFGKMAAMAFAAAAVTVLKGKDPVDKMLASVARAAGIERKALKSFRDNINRGLSPPACQVYEQYVMEVQDWPPEQIMKTLPHLRPFVS